MPRVALAALFFLLAAPTTGSTPLVRLPFAFSQGGIPTEDVVGGPVSTTNGSGVISVARPLRAGPSGYFEEPARVARGSRLVHVERIGGRSVRLVLTPIAASAAAFADGSRLIELTVRVVSSTDGSCSRGREGRLTLEDNRSEPDVLGLRLCVPRYDQHFQDGVRGRVWVQIGIG